ncbi:molybdenum cofactor synthesis domain protein [Xylanimonas cellulosilytica DSM 15894]|uniref:Molybdopterin molybdenumtransferase n=1 Tax=Xylanimonas cellulosilytica (strain DSM 15894 / JCM 12276 / CECT 5975 / KCTC 9989 / LMG 20990 / NBRC 107835 / XIL07) TaxID=446471 RepID=D1BT07_XYLCX|nr:gephyrin-like molybdotransferase Glp [Xylanimonas cellulosilytica]ACZ30849.1 molybdenum cofactor synthesis domain protein [Xylanimonas cellulosilytica DSM 15894]
MSEPRYRTIGDHVAAVLARVGSPTAVGRARPARPDGTRDPRDPRDPRGPDGPVALRLPLDDAAVAGPGLVLTDDVVAVWPVPGFDHAAVDGYAVRLADVPAEVPATLRVVGAVRAGDPGSAGLGPAVGQGLGAAQAVRVMTGAPLPPGADAVVPVEATSTSAFIPGVDGTETAVTLTRPRKDNVRRRGEDVAAGTVLRARGEVVSPALIAAAAAAGVTGLDARRGASQAAPGPRVAVISTGSELRPAGTRLGPGGIVDSNSLMLAAIVRAAGAEPVRRGGVPDDAAALRAALDEVAPGVDLIVTTGGVSAGAWDVVRQVLTAPGTPAADVDLTGVAMRPGRPQGLAVWRGVPWIALPGTPVAAFVAAHLFVRPTIAALRGAAPTGVGSQSAVAGSASWPGPGVHGCGGPGEFTRVVPVRAVPGPERLTVVPTAGTARGGHALSALLDADALALVPSGGARPGDPLEVVPL